jgi:hypothetical protein
MNKDLCHKCQKHVRGTDDTLCLSCRLEVEKRLREELR